MNIEEIIKEGESFKIDAELDYSGEATWINDSKLNEYHQWVHKTLLYLRDNFSDNATCIDFSNLSKKYANTNNFVEYGSFDTSASKTFTFTQDEKVISWYFEIYDRLYLYT